jgi:protein-S-isoprenylcysteine O-methyltransferase Ste14
MFFRFLVDKRVVISFILFTTMIVVQMLVGLRPHSWWTGGDLQGLAGVSLVLLGVFIRSWAAGVLFKGKALAVVGPYSLCRHPLYLGSFCMMVGFCLLIGNPLHLAVVLGPIAGIYWVTMFNEERRVASKYAQSWEAYSSTVPRFIPWRLTGYVPAPFKIQLWTRNHEYRALLTAVAGLTALEIWRTY